MIALSGMYQQTLQKLFLCYIKVAVQSPYASVSTLHLKDVNVSITLSSERLEQNIVYFTKLKTNTESTLSFG